MYDPDDAPVRELAPETLHDVLVNGADAAAMPMTYWNLRALLDAGRTAIVPGVVEIQAGPTPDLSGSRSISFMVGGQRVAELSPPGDAPAGGYLSLLEEWDGQPVAHYMWKHRLRVDNGLDEDEDAEILGMAQHVLRGLVALRGRIEPADTGAYDAMLAEAQALAEYIVSARDLHATYDDALAAPRNRLALAGEGVMSESELARRWQL